MIVSVRAENIAFDIKDTLKICQEILSQRPDHVFLTMLWENWKPHGTVVWADNFLHQHNIKVTWIVNHWSKDDATWKKFKNPVVFFDFVLWRVYNEVIVKGKNEINARWNSSATQYLFLTGKPYKEQRIGLLYLLYKRKLLDKCNYSLFMDPGMYEKSRKILPDISDEEFKSFVEMHTRTPDNAVYVKQVGDMHCGGIPYDKKLYSSSLFKVISEASMDSDPPYVTEKVWLTLLNRNPFVIAGDLNICKYLRTRGIETFDNIFNVPTYDDIVSIQDRLQQITVHIEQWLAGKFNKIEIDNMVEHNYNRFVELALEQKSHLETSIGYNIELVINTGDFLAGEID